MVINATPQPLKLRGRDPMPILYEDGWAPRPIWTDKEILAATEIRSPDRAAGRESLYRSPNSFFKNRYDQNTDLTSLKPIYVTHWQKNFTQKHSFRYETQLHNHHLAT